MNKFLLSLFIIFSITSYGQSLSKTHVIYESKDQIVLNNGLQYKILVDKPFFEVTDPTVEKNIQVVEHTLRLNRVLILQSDNEYKELIEWTKGNMKFYESRELVRFNLEGNNISDSQLSTKE